MQRYSVEESTFKGANIYILKDSKVGLRATFLPEMGSQLISLYSEEVGIEFIKGPESLEDRTTSIGFPILMPPNRIKNGRFTFNDREYILDINERGRENHIHGFVHNKSWKVKDVGANIGGAWIETVILSTDEADITRQFPHDFELSMKYLLRDGALDITSRCANKGEDAMPFGIGFHPYFKVPLSESSSKSMCSLKVPANKVWELEECIPTGRLIDLNGAPKDLREGASLEGMLLDDVYTDLEPKGDGSTCLYIDEGAKVGLRFTADAQFLHWVVYSGKTLDSDFICFEPYTWVTNAPNLHMSPRITGFRVLEPGEEFIGEMKLSFFRL
jgi:aldose 1-epimerase